MRTWALALLSLGGCQLVLGIDDPSPPGTTDDAAVPDAAVFDGAPGPPDAEPPDALPAGQCLEGGTTPRAIDPPTGGELWINEVMVDPSSAADASGEWIELRATAPFDLNGLTLTNTTASQVLDAAACLHLDTGDLFLLVRSANPADNGGINNADATFSVSLPNAPGRIEIRDAANTELRFVNWTSAPTGTSYIVADPNVCSAPAGTASYNGTDIGTPGAANIPATCP